MARERNRLGFRAIKSGEARRARAQNIEARAFSRRRPSSYGVFRTKAPPPPSFDSSAK